MNSNITTRNSNIELLRVVAIIMIVVYHISLHVVRYQIVDTVSIALMGNGLFCHPQFYKRLFLVEGMFPLGSIANDIFILISGYFMVEKGSDVRLGRVAKKLFLQMGYSIMALLLLSTVYYSVTITSERTRIFLPTVDLFNSISMNWFVGYYFVIIVIGGLYLNKYLGKCDRTAYRVFLIVLFCVVSVGWSGGLLDSIASGLRVLFSGVFLYAFGGYIKKYQPFERVRLWALLIALVGIIVLVYISYKNTTNTSINGYLVNKVIQEEKGNSVDPYIQSFPGFNTFDIVSIVVSVVLLELFRRIRIPNSKIINFLGASTFMIYLMHDNDFIRVILRRYDWIEMLWNNPMHYCLNVLLCTAIILLMGVIAYALYIALSKVLYSCRGLVIKTDQQDP